MNKSMEPISCRILKEDTSVTIPNDYYFQMPGLIEIEKQQRARDTSRMVYDHQSHE
jgi:hypothetical protein